MKQTFYSLLALLGLSTLLTAQTVVYQEDFDSSPIGGSCTSRGGSTGAAATPVPAGQWCWNDTNVTFTSAPNSYHTETPLSSDTVVFESASFSTVGNTFVQLSFFQKALMFGSMRAEIEVSNNNGATWTKLTGTQYLGASGPFPTLGYFNITSYPTNTSIWGTPTAPLNVNAAQWVQEEFNVSAFLGGANGFANCKVRFIYRSIQGNILPSANWNQFDGWYIDDVEVVAAPCEVTPPTASFNLNPVPVPCYDNQPQGGILNVNPKIGIDASDPSGMNQVRLIYSVNGGADQTILMTNPGAGQPNRWEYQFPVGLLSIGDTVAYYIEAEDASCINNVRRLPGIAGSRITFWVLPGLPSKCGAAACGSTPTVISTFPWTENFEGNEWVPGVGTGDAGVTHRGTFPTFPVSNWEVSPNTTSAGMGWSIRQGAHPASNTGPSGDHTTGNGKYVYMETSQSSNPPNTQLITPCIDFGNLNGCISLEFFYHKFGASMGNLRIDVDTGSNSSAWWNGYVVIPGSTHSSQSAPWTKSIVDLTPFAGQLIRLRFTGTRVGATGDMAIDDLRIFEPDPVEMELVDFIAPVNGFCSYSSTQPVRIKVRNQGCQTITSIPIRFNLNGTNYNDVINTSLASGDTLTYTFTPTADLSAFITHSISVFVEAPGDANPANNSMGPRNIQHDPSISGFPYFLNFDGPTTVPGNGTPTNPGTLGTTDWTIAPLNNSASNFSWYVGTGMTPTNLTGPYGGYQSANYLYTEGNYGTAPASAVLLSECIDLGGLSAPYIDFMYHFYGPDAGALVVQVKPETSNNFSSVGGAILGTNASQTMADEFDEWKLRHIDLSAFANQTVQIRIVVQKTGTGQAADVAIDELRIYDQAANDVGIIAINTPGGSVSMPANTGPQVTIQNYGSTAVTSIPLSITLTPACGGAPVTINNTWTGTLQPGSSINHTITNIPAYIRGAQELCISTNLTGDSYSFNNDYCKYVTGFEDLPIPFFTDFESCDRDEHGFNVMANVGGKTYRLWRKKTGNGAHSGQRSWKTGTATQNYREDSREALRLPRFFGFDSIMGAEIRFWHKFNFAAGDGGQVQYFNQGSWEALGDAVPLPDYPNWYANPSLGTTQVAALNDEPGFSGNSNGWVLSTYPLAFMNNNTSPLALRFMSGSNNSANSTGWEIDDFEIYVPPQFSAAPIDIRTVANLPFPGDNQLMVRIENSGARPLDSCEVTVWADNTFIGSQKVRFDPPLDRGRSRWDTIQGPWLGATSGAHNVCAYTQFPNGRGFDDFTGDDSLCKNLVILNIVSNIDTIGYCNDFDNPAQEEWLTLNYATYGDGFTFWEKGTPGQASINGAFSGNNAWMVNLNNNYRNRDSSALFTPVFEVDSTHRYRISFMHNFKTERYHDGGTIDISKDGGVSWETVGEVRAQWFNTQFVTSLDVIKPGWTYQSNGWIPASLVVQIPKTGPVIFRYRFGSDQGIETEGWAIDDFCFQQTFDQTEYYIGLEDRIPGLAHLGELYPNPAKDQTRIDLNLIESSDVTIRVYDLMGKELLVLPNSLERGAHTLQIPTSQLAAGLYIIGVEVDGQRIVKKLIID